MSKKIVYILVCSGRWKSKNKSNKIKIQNLLIWVMEKYKIKIKTYSVLYSIVFIYFSENKNDIFTVVSTEFTYK